MMQFSSSVKNRTDGFEPVAMTLQESPSPRDNARDTAVLVDSERSDEEPPREIDHERKPKKKPTPPPAPNAANKILFLDGLRGLAAMMVIVQHAGYMGVFIGQPAVDTFFVLSAFLLTMIFEKKARTLMQEQASRRRWGWALLDYFMRRFLRVYPLFVLVAVIVSFYPPVLREQIYHVHHLKEYNLFKVLTFEFSSRYHVFWTLPLEISYYFIIPIFVVALLALKKFWWVPLLPLSFYVVYAGFYFYRMDHLGLGPHLPTFLAGSISAMIYAKMEQWIKRNKFEFRWWHWLVLRSVEMFFLAVMFSVLFGGLVFSWFFKNPVPHISGAPFISVNISIVMVCEMLLPGAVASVLEWSLLRYAGKISFSMYLMHSFVIYQTWVKKQGFWNRFYLNFGLTFLLSTVTYHLVEYPCQVAAARLGARIKQRDVLERQRTQPTLPVSEEKLHA